MRLPVLFLALSALLFLPACSEETVVPVAKKEAPWLTVAERLAEEAGRPSLDYSNADYWACNGEKTDDVCDAPYTMARHDTDGTVTYVDAAPAPNPIADCFYIYPTVDLRVGDENHDDMEDVLLPRRVVESQAAPFSEACRVFAPFYRQAVLGNYALPADEAVPQFLRALADVTAAFEYYLENWNEGRPIVLMGHSQGAQMTSYLLHKYFDGATAVTAIAGSETSDVLRKRLVAAMPIGFSVFTKKGELVGGSFSDLPLCSSISETGCVVAYRTYPEEFQFYYSASNVDLETAMAERGYLHRPYEQWDDAIACVNPAAGPSVAPENASSPTGKPLSNGDIRLLLGTRTSDVVLTENGTPERKWVPGRYTATCRYNDLGDYYLAIGFHYPQGVTDQRDDPNGVNSTRARSALGLHLQDFHLPMGDLIQAVRSKVQAFRAPD